MPSIDPMADAAKMPQGLVKRTMVTNLLNFMLVSPAKIHIASSGKNGRRNIRANSISPLDARRCPYLFEICGLTNLSAKGLPNFLANTNTNIEPDIIAVVLIINDFHNPNIIPPATELILLGIGANITEAS